MWKCMSISYEFLCEPCNFWFIKTTIMSQMMHLTLKQSYLRHKGPQQDFAECMSGMFLAYIYPYNAGKDAA